MPHPRSSTPPESVWAFRRRFGLTQPALAELLAVPAPTLARYERQGGPRWLGYALATLAGEMFDVPVAEVRPFVRPMVRPVARGADQEGAARDR